MENRVGFWPRLGAYAIDFALTFGIVFALRNVLSDLLPAALAEALAEAAKADKPDTPATAKAMTETIARTGIAATIVSPIYALIEGLTGWSPGKLLLGLRIAGDDGQRAPVSTLLARFVVKGSAPLIAFAGLLTGMEQLSTGASVVSAVMIGGCFLALRSSRQALHDVVVKTAVLRKSDLSG